MGKILPLWIKVWLIASTIICAIDMSYTMLRPHSLRDGVLGKLYYFWHIYADVDVRYANAHDLTSMSTGRLMTIELIMNIMAIFMDRKQSRHTLLTVFTSSVMVFWKTSIYLCLYIYPVAGNIEYIVEGTPFWRLMMVFWLPNSFWVLVPLAVMIALWNRLAISPNKKQLSRNKLVLADEDSENSSLNTEEKKDGVPIV